MKKFALWLFFLIDLASCQEEPVLTYEDYFQFGKNEYTDKNWPDCVAFMKRAIDDFRYFEDELVACRKKCSNSVEKPTEIEPRIAGWHETSEIALCLMRCRRDRLGDNRPDIRKMTIYFDMMERKPYQYMHICYYRLGELGMAVQSAYTFLVKNPTDRDTVASIKYYMNQPQYSPNMLIDVERADYETRFINGVEAYDEQDWSKCVHEFEMGLEKTMQQDDRCRYLCEDKVDWSVVEGSPDIDVLIASMRSSIVRCQHNCLYKLGVVNGHYIGNMIAAHYEYLHFCQYKSMKGSDAARSVGNYLLFDDNPLMRRNKHFYLKQYEKIELFEPDERILNFFKKRQLETRYLNFVEQRFRLVNNELPPDQADDRKPLDTTFSIIDEFPYSSVPKLMDSKECYLLRAALVPTSTTQAFINELSHRIQQIWPNAKFDSSTCGGTREAQCDRPIVLSLEKPDCSEWLGKWFSGCAIVFCDRK